MLVTLYEVEKQSRKKMKKKGRKAGRIEPCLRNNVIKINFDSHYCPNIFHVVDPYGDLTNVIGRLVEAMAVGTNDERDPYLKYLVSAGSDFDSNPGFFQTYTFDHDTLSLVSFLDRPTKDLQEGKVGADELGEQLGRDLLKISSSLMATREEEDLSAQRKIVDDGPYQVPETRAVGRPHMMGWLELLGDEEITGGESEGDSSAEAESYDSDEWRVI